MQVMAKTSHIGACFSTNGDRVRHATNLKLTDREFANLDRVIDQLGIIIGDLRPESVFFGAFAAHRCRNSLVFADRFLGLMYLEFSGNVLLHVDRW